MTTQTATATATLQLRALSASLTVDDLDRSLRFYQGVGCEVKERWEEDGKLLGVMFKAGECEFGISQDDFAKGRGRQKGVGFRLWAQTAQDLEEIAAQARANGIEAEPKQESWGRTLTFTDPDGFKLTLHQS
jgi:catechol 2,3-dioxygenase-like lactoylglutathione lyase family enzyme